MELAGFCRVDLDAGQSTTVEFAVPVSLLAFLDTQLEWLVEAGDVEVMVGASSADIRLRDRIVVRRSAHRGTSSWLLRHGSHQDDLRERLHAYARFDHPGPGVARCRRQPHPRPRRLGSSTPTGPSTGTARTRNVRSPGSGICHWGCAATLAGPLQLDRRGPDHPARTGRPDLTPAPVPRHGPPHIILNEASGTYVCWVKVMSGPSGAPACSLPTGSSARIGGSSGSEAAGDECRRLRPRRGPHRR